MSYLGSVPKLFEVDTCPRCQHHLSDTWDHEEQQCGCCEFSYLVPEWIARSPEAETADESVRVLKVDQYRRARTYLGAGAIVAAVFAGNAIAVATIVAVGWALVLVAAAVAMMWMAARSPRFTEGMDA